MIHHYSYWVHVANYLPIGLTVALVFVAIFTLMVFVDTSIWFAVGAAAILLCFLTIPVFYMKWHHREMRHYDRMTVLVNGETVWVPAHRLANGVWWPNNGRVKP